MMLHGNMYAARSLGSRSVGFGLIWAAVGYHARGREDVLTAAGAAEDLAVAVVDVARTAAGEHEGKVGEGLQAADVGGWVMCQEIWWGRNVDLLRSEGAGRHQKPQRVAVSAHLTEDRACGKVEGYFKLPRGGTLSACPKNSPGFSSRDDSA